MNLLARRNLLYQVVPAPSPQFRSTSSSGAPEYPRAEAADPSAFALRIRRELTDERRTLRVFGSEVVICRLTGDGVAGRGCISSTTAAAKSKDCGFACAARYRHGEAYVVGAGRLALDD